MNQHPLFSILVANYNNAAYINDAFNSILAQTYANWEVIIVDDASTDNSIQVLQPWTKDDRFKLFCNDKNYGCGYTKGKCTALASGEICGFLDPDDVLTSDALEIMANKHTEHPDAALIYSDFFTCDKLLQHKNYVKNKQLPESISYLLFAQPAIGHFSTFKKEKYNSTPGINANLQRAVDQDLFYKMEEAGDLVHVGKALYFYRLHKGGISVFENFNKAFSWHVYVVIDACKRRNIPFEDIVSKMVKHYYIDFYEQSKAFKLGSLMIMPFKKLKGLLSNYISIRANN